MTPDLTHDFAAQVRAVSGRPVAASTPFDMWAGLSAAIVDRIADAWEASETVYAATRQEHYFSAEFLMGRALLNNLANLGLVDKARAAVGAFGQDLSVVLEEEEEPMVEKSNVVASVGTASIFVMVNASNHAVPVLTELYPPTRAQTVMVV